MRDEMSDDNTPGQQLLQDFHRRHPGATSRSLAHGRTADGESSYDLLCNAAQQAPHNATIVDLGCGDGYLLELVRGALPGSHLVGVDMSRAEVDAAKERLAGSRPELLVAHAQSLPLADASVDVVLCHMALMLMEDVELVISEIARVLRPGGVVAVVVSSGSWPAGTGQNFKRLMREAVDQFGGACPRLGDTRTSTTEGLLSLFDNAAGFEVQRAPGSVTLALDDAPEKVWASLELMYNFAALSQDGRDHVTERFLDAVTGDVDRHGKLTYRSSLLYASFRRLLDSPPRSAPTDGGRNNIDGGFPMSASLQRIVIACNQIDAMAGFYEAVLDCPFEKVDCGEFHFYDGRLGGLALRLFPANIAGIDVDENRHQLMFGVESLEAVLERGISRGGELQGDIAESGERRRCCLIDPDGNTVEFVE